MLVEAAVEERNDEELALDEVPCLAPEVPVEDDGEGGGCGAGARERRGPDVAFEELVALEELDEPGGLGDTPKLVLTAGGPSAWVGAAERANGANVVEPALDDDSCRVDEAAPPRPGSAGAAVELELGPEAAIVGDGLSAMGLDIFTS